MAVLRSRPLARTTLPAYAVLVAFALITLALSALGNNQDAVKLLVEKVAPKYMERKGGYTRVLRAGFRLGDNGTKALFELV